MTTGATRKVQDNTSEGTLFVSCRAYLATRAPPTGLLGAGRAIVGADPRCITVLIPAEDTSGRAEK